MIDIRITLMLPLLFVSSVSLAQAGLPGQWKLADGSCVYELRRFEDGQLEARVLRSTRPNEKEGRIVLDHIEPEGHANMYKAVIHSAGMDVPREAFLSLGKDGRTIELQIPRPLVNVHISWLRQDDDHPVGSGGSLLSLNE